MKKIELYECEICNTKYNEKIKATNCEKSHQSKMQIKDFRFLQNDKYPVKLLIEFENGHKIWYRT